MVIDLSIGSEWYLWEVWEGGRKRLIAVNSPIDPDSADGIKLFPDAHAIALIGKIDLYKLR